jgi:BCD family chlorophyll transporter-like MFS transporter
MNDPATAYGFVYHLEILLLFGALVAIGPLARHSSASPSTPHRFGLAELPA